MRWARTLCLYNMHEFVEPVGRVESREAIIIIIEVVVDKMFDDDLRVYRFAASLWPSSVIRRPHQSGRSMRKPVRFTFFL